MTRSQTHTLDNGLRVVLQPDPTLPIVGLALYYDVGSRNEQPGSTGFAHLFEHLMFEGSAHVGKTEHFRLVQGWGGQLNGTTSQDRTNYYESLPAHQLALGLWLEADRMRALALNEENFENQRSTVMEERRSRVDNTPYGLSYLRFGELSFSCFAYAHPVIGSWEDLRAARFEDALGFHRRWYRPDNAVLALAGDLDPDEALRLVGDYFGDIEPGGDRAEPDLDEPPRQGAVEETLVAPLAQLPAIFLSHQAPPVWDPDFYVYEVIETLLTSGPSGRLYRRLVVEEAVAVEVNGGYEAHRGPSLFAGYLVAPRGGDLDRLARLYLDELERLGQEPVLPAELDKVLNQLRTARLLGQESPLQRALALGRAALYHGDPAWEDQYLSGVARVSPDDILRVARRDLRPDRAVRLNVVPR